MLVESVKFSPCGCIMRGNKVAITTNRCPICGGAVTEARLILLDIHRRQQHDHDRRQQKPL